VLLTHAHVASTLGLRCHLPVELHLSPARRLPAVRRVARLQDASTSSRLERTLQARH